MGTWIGLLRAVNVGGRKLPMADLRQMVADLGGGDPRTYIQSGQVVWTGADGAGLAARLEEAIEARFGFASPVIVRTPAQLREALAARPFPEAPEDDVHLGFLSAVPDAKKVAAMPPDRSPPDRYEVVGQDIHLWYPKGVGKSKVTTQWLDKQLGVTVTVRNKRTTRAILDLC